eukprot:TRINITY_DN3866_c0_g1_i1.p1 TRINITY_DN3866_c0_g1~~TRINITY_DN3866_c0_g1_i1.p1  ORF type:complete len:464 (-),score=69.62 TRINITY_DN3866_c0_g1_i1:83-1474(-)
MNWVYLALLLGTIGVYGGAVFKDPICGPPCFNSSGACAFEEVNCVPEDMPAAPADEVRVQERHIENVLYRALVALKKKSTAYSTIIQTGFVAGLERIPCLTNLARAIGHGILTRDDVTKGVINYGSDLFYDPTLNVNPNGPDPLLGGPVLGIFDVSIFNLTGPEAAALINAHSTPDDILRSTGHNWVGISAIQQDDEEYIMTVILVHVCHGSEDSGAQTHSAATNCSYFLESDATRKAELEQCFSKNQIDPIYGQKFNSEGRWYSSSLNPASSVFQMPVFTGGNDNAYWCANNAITAEDDTEVGSLLIEVSTQTCEWNVIFNYNDPAYSPEAVFIVNLITGDQENLTSLVDSCGAAAGYSPNIFADLVGNEPHQFTADGVTFDSLCECIAFAPFAPQTEFSASDQPACLFCGGLNNTDPAICSGNGECVAFDTCECVTGYIGQFCDIEYCRRRDNDDENARRC